MSGPILLVHDDLATIAAARRVLAAEGHEVVLATSAADAIISFGQRTPKLVVLAPAVDGGRGPSVHAEIRSLPHGQAVRFVLLGAALPDVDDAQHVPLPVEPEVLRQALRQALSTEGAGWELQTAARTQEEPAPRLATDAADPWRVAEARTTLGPAEPLADQLFGDLRAEDPGTPGARVPSGATPLSHRHLPSARTPENTDPVAAPTALAEVPSEAPPLDPAEGTSPVALSRPKTLAPPPEPATVERSFDELDLPASELELLVQGERKAADDARDRVAEALFARDQESARRDALQREVAETRKLRAAAQADLVRTEALQKQLGAEVAGLQAQLEGALAARQETEASVEEAAQAVKELESRRAAAVARLAAEQRAREEATRALAEAEKRRAVLAGSVDDAEAAARAEREEVEALERRRAALEGSAQDDAAKTSAAREQAEAQRARLAELEQARRDAEAKAQMQAAQRAEAEHALEALAQEREQLQQVLGTLGEAEVQAQRTIAELAERKQTLAQERERLAEGRAEAEARARTLQAERAQLQAAVQRAEQQVAVERDKLQTLQRTREAAEVKLSKVAAAHQRTQGELQGVRGRIEEAQAENARMQAELAAREQELSALMHARESALDEAARAEQALSKLQAALSQREKDRETLVAAHAEATSQLAALRAQVDSHGERQSDAARERAEGRRALRELQQELAQATESVAGLGAERDQVAGELEQLAQARQQLADELLGLAERKRSLSVELSSQQRAREEALQALTAQRDALEQALTELTSQAEQHGGALGELEAVRVTLAAEIDALQSRLDAESAGAQARAEQRRELEAQLAALTAERDARKARSEALAAEREAFARFVAEAEGALAKRPPTRGEGATTRPAAPPSHPDEPPAPAPPAPRRRLVAAGRFQPPAPLRPLPELPEQNLVDPASVPPFADGPVSPRAPSWGERGELPESGAAAFLARVFAERVSGRFDFTLRDGARALYFEEGRLVAALSSAPGDRLESLAQRDGLITRAQERALRAESPDLAPRQLAVRMVELQLIKGTELYNLVRRHMEQVAYALFTDERVPFAFTAEVAPAEHRVALPVHPLAFVLEGVRRKGDFDRLNAALGGPSALVRLREGAPELSDLGLSARERRFVQLIDGLRTVEELVFASGVEPPAAVKLLHGLAAAGVVEVWPSEAASAPEDVGAGLHIDLSRVAEKYAQVRSGDYFEILGVEREATSYEVRAAFERLSREFHPMRFAAIEDAALPARLEEISRMVAEAADVLADDHTRRSYARNLSESR